MHGILGEGGGVLTSQESRWHWREFEWAIMGSPRWPVASVFFNLLMRRDSVAMIGLVARGLGGFGSSSEARWHWGESEWAMMVSLSWPGASVFFSFAKRRDSVAMIGLKAGVATRASVGGAV